MIKEFLDGLENLDRPLLGPNYWLLEKLCMILPTSMFSIVICLFFHELATFFVITQYMELYVIRTDLDRVLTNMKISMLSIVCVVKVNTVLMWQGKWKMLLEYITTSDKYERDHETEYTRPIVQNYTKYCRSINYFYWTLVFTTVITVTNTPLIIYLSSQSFREGLRNGTELFPHIFSSWVPFDKYHSPGCWITIAWHFFICLYGAAVMAAYDTTVIVIMVYFGGKLDLIRERSKHMFDKLKDNLYQDVVETPSTSISLTHTERIIKQLHENHVLLTKNSILFNSLLSPVMFLYVVMCSLMLCASAFQFTSAADTTQRLLQAEYLIFGVAQLFLFCWHSNDVIQKSDLLKFGPYESGWISVNKKHWKSLFLLAGQYRIKHIFTAGPFSQLTLSTFINILKGAYSYYTLLRK